MNLKTALLISITFLFTFNYFGQHKMDNSNSFNTEIPHYYKDGIKMSVKNNTPLLISNINDFVKKGDPSEMAFDWISQNKELLKIQKISNLKVYFKRSSLSGHTVRFQQLLNNVPVYNKEIVVHISPKNSITYVTNTYDPSVQNINTVASISKQQAFLFAKNKIKAEGKLSYSSNELYIYNELTTTQLIYKVIIESQTPIGSWEVLVNAQNGNIIRAVDKAYYHKKNPKKSILLPKPLPPVNGTGNVFLSDPLSFANVNYGGNYSDNNDATNAQLDAATSSVTLLDIDNTGGTYKLSGPFAEIVDSESPFNGLFTQGSPNFNFNRNDDAFEAVNCYYLVDKSMRYINQTLGITLMPFQYSGGVQFDPHGLNGSDNSHYSGGSGIIAFGEGGVDDAEDADVVIHELGHGIHDWLTGGNLSQVNGLSEGSGDYWGQSYSRSLGQWTPADPQYNWFFDWDGHNPFWNGRITNSTATYPGGLVGQVHADGQIWATVLMRIYDIIGREKVDKAFLEGLGMTGGSTNQQDAAIAVRQAAIDMGYSCPDIDVFTQEFTTTGYNMPPLNLAQFPPVVADTTTCDGTNVIINGNGNSLNWYSDALLTNLLTTGTTLNTGQSTAGTYTYYVKYSDPACSVAPSDTIVLTITTCAPMAPVANFTSLSSNICVGDCISFSDLSTGAPTSWVWHFFGATTANSNVQNPTNICYNTTGSFDVALVSINATGQDSLFMSNFITVNTIPTITALSDTAICAGDFAILDATGGIAYNWDNGLGAGQNQSVSPSSTTTYTVTGTDANGCSNTDQVLIFVNPLPTISIAGNAIICLGDSAVLNATGGTSYSWNNGSVISSITVSPSTTTTYTVTGTDGNACSNTALFVVTVVTVDVSTSISALGNGVAANASSATYQWIDCDNGNAIITGETNQVFTATVSGNYAVIITQNGCIDTSACVNLTTVGINQLDEDDQISIYPNPTSNELNVSLIKGNTATQISLIDNLGRIVYQLTPKKDKIVIDLSEFAKGIYTLLVKTDEKVISRKVVKE